MKLKELFKPSVKKLPHGELEPEDQVSSDAKVTEIGDGMYANAAEHSDKIGEVVKTSNPIQSIAGDGYLQFLSKILKNNRLQDNPYLPKIYSLNIYQKLIKGNKYYFYKIRMEKLRPLTSLSIKELQYIINKAFHITSTLSTYTQDTLNNMLPKSRDKTKGKPEEYTKEQLLHIIVETLDNALRQEVSTNNTVNIKDPKLKQAIYIIKSLIRNNKGFNDMHPGNIMYRLTSVGPQLVIIDPLSDADPI